MATDIETLNGSGVQADASGHFSIVNLAPGKYRVSVWMDGAPPPEEGGQEIELHEGETATIDVKSP